MKSRKRQHQFYNAKKKTPQTGQSVPSSREGEKPKYE